jgi:8-oxo-dGTP pyrophosphatase MutT (NUDIX family)
VIETVRSALVGYQPRRGAAGETSAAAVLIALYERGGEHHVILTKRSEKVLHHKGEISFPGGAFDPTDPDLQTTALREAFEEVGLHPDDVEVLGELDEFVTVTNFRVSPFVGLVKRSPYEWVPSVDEVAVVIEYPLRLLLSGETFARELIERDGEPYEHLTYTYDGHTVWGATARMLTQFLEVLRASGIAVHR